MGQLRNRMETDLQLGGYSASTQKIYLSYARLFAKHHMRCPAEMGETEIREYLLYMVQERKIVEGSYRQIRAALTFLYTVTLKRKIEVEHIPVRRKKVKLPVVLSGTEVNALLDEVRVDKYRAIVMAQYVEACASLRLADFGSRTSIRSAWSSISVQPRVEKIATRSCRCASSRVCVTTGARISLQSGSLWAIQQPAMRAPVQSARSFTRQRTRLVSRKRLRLMCFVTASPRISWKAAST
jgi:hypothetical protein